MSGIATSNWYWPKIMHGLPSRQSHQTQSPIGWWDLGYFCLALFLWQQDKGHRSEGYYRPRGEPMSKGSRTLKRSVCCQASEDNNRMLPQRSSEVGVNTWRLSWRLSLWSRGKPIFIVWRERSLVLHLDLSFLLHFQSLYLFNWAYAHTSYLSTALEILLSKQAQSVLPVVASGQN